MKQFLIAVAIILFSNNALAQNLTLAQILEVKKKDLGNAEEYLTTKGWEFKNAKEPSLDKLGKVTFTYNKSNISDLADSYFHYYYSSYSVKTRVSVQIHAKAKYNEYINSIKGYGCKLMNSKVEEGRIIKIYRGATTTFEVTSGTSSNFYSEETAIWNICIFSNEDYDSNWGDE